MCRAPGSSVLFGAGGSGPGRGVRTTEEGRGPVIEPSLCRWNRCEVPSLTHLVMSFVMVFFAMASSMV
ncbi:hypothetical protein F4560_007600 [Saccharothrix ecbatanensis]|uniref:Uncharacterized protein n=1 Tax=Saccharothrix ecbatanensis TaxID=1105145 RepID=A0A7W9HSV4_9PSEU|nr:hypothetical protein [Saccharothrix ecbatanensis]